MMKERPIKKFKFNKDVTGDQSWSALNPTGKKKTRK